MKVGSDVSQLIHTKYAAGVQRVVVETHKNLVKVGKDRNQEFIGVNLSGNSKVPSHNYIAGDPLIIKNQTSLDGLDFVCLLDANVGYVFDHVRKNGFNGQIVTLIHDILPITHPKYFNFEDDGNYVRAFKTYILKILNFSNHIIVTSNYTKQQILNLNWKINCPIEVIKLGTFKTSAATISNDNHESINLLSVNTIEPRKGHSDIMDAFDILIENNKDCNLIFVGKYGWDSVEIKNRILNHRLFGKKLFWYSGITDEEMGKLYEKSDIAIVGALEEGFGLTLEEGLAFKKKVIVRDLPIFRERRANNMYFFSGNGVQLANRILEVKNSELDLFSPLRTMADFADDLSKLLLSLK